MWIVLLRLEEEGEEDVDLGQSVYEIYNHNVEVRVFKTGVNLLLLTWMKEFERIFYGNVYDPALLPDAKPKSSYGRTYFLMMEQQHLMNQILKLKHEKICPWRSRFSFFNRVHILRQFLLQSLGEQSINDLKELWLASLLEITTSGLSEISTHFDAVNEDTRPHTSLVWALGDIRTSLKGAVYRELSIEYWT
uniref:Ubiquinol-cytochrome c chaperone domain-containing protein n=1 Tax=Brassica oleracea TaxID=3712 RepID=A0A3P6D758_BRAOL|nr:unnamed protein product [Brassica oleracea]